MNRNLKDFLITSAAIIAGLGLIVSLTYMPEPTKPKVKEAFLETTVTIEATATIEETITVSRGVTRTPEPTPTPKPASTIVTTKPHVTKVEAVDRLNRALAGSPMAGYEDTFYEYANKFNLDWRLSAGIAKIESGYGRQTPGGFNAWGMTCGCSTYRIGCGTVQGISWDRYPNWGTAILAHNDYIFRKWGSNAGPYNMRGYATSPTWPSKVNSAMNSI